MAKFKFIFLFIVIVQASIVQAQVNKMQEQLYFQGTKGLAFIPPLSRPALLYNKKMYVGKKQLQNLFLQFNNPEMMHYYVKYVNNKTAADVLSLSANFALPIANVIVTSKTGKLNWWLIGSAVATSLVGNYFNIKAQSNLMQAVAYYETLSSTTVIEKNDYPIQNLFSIQIPLVK